MFASMFSNLPHFIHIYGLAGLFIIIFLESSIIFPLPGDSLLFTAGLIAASPRHYLNIWSIIPIFFLASFTGYMFGYFIGERVTYLNRFSIFRKLISKKNLDAVHVFFEEYGRPSLLFARFVPIVRTFAPIGAGIGRMKYSDFLKYNVIGAFLWSTIITSIGYFLGRTFPGIQQYLSLMIILVIAVSVLPAVPHMLKHRKKNAHKRTTEGDVQ